MKNKKIVVGLACQIVYEYDWTDQHVSDMLNTYDDGEKRPCDYDTLMDMCYAVDKLKKQGKSYKQAVKMLGGK